MYIPPPFLFLEGKQTTFPVARSRLTKRLLVFYCLSSGEPIPASPSFKSTHNLLEKCALPSMSC